MEAIRDAGKDEAVARLREIIGHAARECHLVVHDNVIPFLNAIGGTGLLKSLGVHKIYLMQSTPPRLHNPESKLLYVCRSQPEEYELVAHHVQVLSDTVKHHYDVTLITLPQRDALCEAILEENGVHGLVSVVPLPLHLVSIDSDLLTMDARLPSRQLCVRDDSAVLSHAACALRQLAAHMRVCWTHVVCAGQAAADVRTLMRELAKQDQRQGHSSGHGGDGASGMGARRACRLVLFDRRVDMVSPLCSQLTYAGMLSETKGVACGTCVAPSPADEKHGDASASAAKPKLTLSADTDEVFARLRDTNFSNVHCTIKEIATDVSRTSDGRHTNDLNQLAAFVKSLPALQGKKRSLAAHLELALQIKREKSDDIVTEMLQSELAMVTGQGKQAAIELIQELICRQHNVDAVLRLILLLRITNTVADKQWTTLRQMVLHAYGFKFLPAFAAMEGVLDASAVAPPLMPGLRRKFPVVVGKDEEQVHYGMHPLSAGLLAQLATATTASDLADLKHCFGDRTPLSVIADEGHTCKSSTGGGGGESGAPHPDVDVVICFLGGTTYAELTRLRERLRSVHARRIRPLFVTTDVVTGDGIAHALYAS